MFIASFEWGYHTVHLMSFNALLLTIFEESVNSIYLFDSILFYVTIKLE